MSAEKNKAVLRRVIKEVINERNLAVVEELFSEEYITHPSLPGRTPGPEIARCNFSNMHATFPDIQATLESIVTEGEWVAIRGTMSGTHEETGKRVTWPLAVFLRFTEGSGRMRQVRLPGRCPTEKVSGIGGMFFRAEDPEALKEWYADNLGVVDSPRDVWRQEGGPTVFAPFSMETDHFGDRRQQFMVNFSVQDLDVLLSQLRAAGVEVVREEEEEGAGRFAWIVDLEGNRVELWEPHPGGFGEPSR